MSTDVFIKELDRVSESEINTVGGKAHKLGVLLKNGFNVPLDFVITTDAYKAFLEKNHLNSYIIDLVGKTSLEAASKLINERILESSP
jgi:phosphoenolpyruvate synthase/pyruvate phosphate dikinase